MPSVYENILIGKQNMSSNVSAKHLLPKLTQPNAQLFVVSSDVCLKWRELPFAQKNIGRELPDDWCCAMHPDPKCNRSVLPS